MGLWQKLKKLSVANLFSSISEADEAFFEEREEALILADVGVSTAAEAVERLRKRMKQERISGQKEEKFCMTYVDGGWLYVAAGYGAQEGGGFCVQVREFYEAANADKSNA